MEEIFTLTQYLRRLILARKGDKEKRRGLLAEHLPYAHHDQVGDFILSFPKMDGRCYQPCLIWETELRGFKWLRVKQLVTNRAETKRSSVSLHFSESQDWAMPGSQLPSPQQFQSSQFQGLANLVKSRQRDSKDEWQLRESWSGEGGKKSIKTHREIQQNEATEHWERMAQPHPSGLESLTQFSLESHDGKRHLFSKKSLPHPQGLGGGREEAHQSLLPLNGHQNPGRGPVCWGPTQVENRKLHEHMTVKADSSSVSQRTGPTLAGTDSHHSRVGN